MRSTHLVSTSTMHLRLRADFSALDRSVLGGRSGGVRRGNGYDEWRWYQPPNTPQEVRILRPHAQVIERHLLQVRLLDGLQRAVDSRPRKEVDTTEQALAAPGCLHKHWLGTAWCGQGNWRVTNYCSSWGGNVRIDIRHFPDTSCKWLSPGQSKTSTSKCPLAGESIWARSVNKRAGMRLAL